MTARKKSKVSFQQLPPLPSELWTPLGMVPVDKVEGLTSSDGAACGCWLNDQRQVKIRAEMSPVTEWQTLGHELAHVILHDSGVQLKKKQEEAVCDALGSYIAAFIIAGGIFPFTAE